MGKGPSIPQIAAKEKKHQRKRSRDYQQEFREQNFQLCDGQNEGNFIPSKRARHRAPDNFHVEGHTMNPPINTNASSISGAVGSQVTVEYLRTGLGTTYPPQTPQSTPGPSQITLFCITKYPSSIPEFSTCIHLLGFLPTLTVQKPNH